MLTAEDKTAMLLEAQDDMLGWLRSEGAERRLEVPQVWAEGLSAEVELVALHKRRSPLGEAVVLPDSSVLLDTGQRLDPYAAALSGFPVFRG